MNLFFAANLFWPDRKSAASPGNDRCPFLEVSPFQRTSAPSESSVVRSFTWSSVVRFFCGMQITGRVPQLTRFSCARGKQRKSRKPAPLPSCCLRCLAKAPQGTNETAKSPPPPAHHRRMPLRPRRDGPPGRDSGATAIRLLFNATSINRRLRLL
jgi:hypothetical protein